MIIIAIMIIMMRMILIMIIIIMMILIIMNRPAGPDSAPATRHGPARSPDEAIYIYIYIHMSAVSSHTLRLVTTSKITSVVTDS